MPIGKKVDEIAYHQRVGTKRVKLFYSGERYMPILEHPSYGVFDFNEKDSSFDVPIPYADILLKASPRMFSKKQSVGLSLDKTDYNELIKKAELAGYDLKKGRSAKKLKEFLASKE